MNNDLGNALVNKLSSMDSLERMAAFYAAFRMEITHWENTGGELGFIRPLTLWKKSLSPEREICYSAIDLCACMG